MAMLRSTLTLAGATADEDTRARIHAAVVHFGRLESANRTERDVKKNEIRMKEKSISQLAQALKSESDANKRKELEDGLNKAKMDKVAATQELLRLEQLKPRNMTAKQLQEVRDTKAKISLVVPAEGTSKTS